MASHAIVNVTALLNLIMKLVVVIDSTHQRLAGSARGFTITTGVKVKAIGNVTVTEVELEKLTVPCWIRASHQSWTKTFFVKDTSWESHYDSFQRGVENTSRIHGAVIIGVIDGFF